jgi:hypothetical protein
LRHFLQALSPQHPTIHPTLGRPSSLLGLNYAFTTKTDGLASNHPGPAVACDADRPRRSRCGWKWGR